jgi:DNA repair protein RadC
MGGLIFMRGGGMTYEIVSERKLRESGQLKRPGEVFEVVKRYAKARQEQFIVLTLDGGHKAISVSIVSLGLVNKAVVHPRAVFCRAIRDMATAVIICHNHPSGNLTPSDEDLEMTKRLREAGEIVGIPVLDHLIIGKPGYYSFRQEGRMGDRA